MRQPADIKRFAKIKVITLAHLFRSLCFAEYSSSVTMSSFMGISIYLYLVRYPYIYNVNLDSEFKMNTITNNIPST